MLLDFLFGCTHRRTTFPITPARRAGFSASNKGTYVVCLDCGKEFGYNWQEMKIGEAVKSTEKEPASDVGISVVR